MSREYSYQKEYVTIKTPVVDFSESEWTKCKKKPVVVWFRKVKPLCVNNHHPVKGDLGEYVSTHEGILWASAERDYIIRGVMGEEYPIKKYIFAKTYEIVSQEQTELKK